MKVTVERAELLKGIAWEFTTSHNPLQPAAGADSERIDVCVELLRHLIATDPCVTL